jgi:dTDP-4-dehydrorhamnose reductase
VKVLLIGRAGQLGSELLRTVPAGVEVAAPDRDALELTDDQAIERVVEKVGPQVVINAAAYTAVDLAETETQLAHSINGAAVGAIANVCSRVGAKLVHVSTDFVFDGASGRPYAPHDAPRPINVYGQSKLAGEELVTSTPSLDWRIVRTAWVYSKGGRNFLLTMLRLFGERDQVRVVADQIGTPTSANSLALAVWRAAHDEGEPALLHFTDAGVASWYDFAVAIYEEATALGILSRTVNIEPIATVDYPTPARRPACSVLDKSATIRRLGIEPIHWRTQLRAVLHGLRA